MDERQQVMNGFTGVLNARLLSRSVLGRNKDGVAPPIMAPEDGLTFTPIDGFQKPLSLEEISTFFGRSAPHSLSKLYDAAPGVPHSGTIKMSDFEGKGCRYRVQGKMYLDRWDDLIDSAGLFPNPDYGWSLAEDLNIGAPHEGVSYPTVSKARWVNALSNSFTFFLWCQGSKYHVISVEKYSVTVHTSHIRNWDDPQPTKMIYKAVCFNDGDFIYSDPFSSQEMYADGNRHVEQMTRDFVVNGEVTSHWSSSGTQAERMDQVKEHISDGFMFFNAANQKAGDKCPFVNYFEVDIDCVIDLCEIQSTIDKPRITYPHDGEADVSPRPTVTCTNFSGEGTHYSTDWEVYSDTTLVRELEVIEDDLNDQINKTSFRVDQILEGELIYYVRCRHRNEQGELSEWSDMTGFRVEKQKGTSWTYHGVNSQLIQFKFADVSLPNANFKHYAINTNTGEDSQILARYAEDINQEYWTVQKTANQAARYTKSMAQNLNGKYQIFAGDLGDGATRKPVIMRIKGYSTDDEDLLSKLEDVDIVDKRSVDDRATVYWVTRGLQVAIDQVTERFWVAGTHDNEQTNHLIWYSDDNGETFTKLEITSDDPLKGVNVFPFTTPAGDHVVMVVYKGYRETSGYGCYSYSTDNGSTWSYSTALHDMGFVGAQDTNNLLYDGKYVYAYRKRNGVGAVKFGILRSSDLVNWTDITANLNAVKPQPFENNTHPVLYTDNAGQLLCVDDQGDFLISVDQGDTWVKDTSLSETGWGQTPITAFYERHGKYYINNSGSGKWATSP